MSTVALKPLNVAPTPDGYAYYDQISFGPGSPPGRPRPQPPVPGGPVDPGYSPPWAQIPVDPGYGIPETGWNRPTHPIALPGDPWWGTGLPTPPVQTPGPGVSAVVIPIPPADPPVEPPEGMPAASKQVMIWFGPGTQPAVAWVAPYASTGPVEPPA